MSLYLIINIFITFIVIGTIKYSPYYIKANNYLINIALFSWVIPYDYLVYQIEILFFIEPIYIISASYVTDINLSNEFITSTFDINILNIFYAFLVIGIFIFIKKFLSHLYWQKKIKQSTSYTYSKTLSQQYNIDIYITKYIPNAALVGFIKPCVWLSSKFINSHYLPLIITHEKQHLKNKDNAKILLLSFYKSIFWWNPLILFLVNEKHYFIEANCDYLSSIKYGKKAYEKGMATLLLDKSISLNKLCSMVLNGNMNIKRIKQLEREAKMNIYKKLGYFSVYSVLIFTMLFAVLTTGATTNINEKGNLITLELDSKFSGEGITDKEGDLTINSIGIITTVRLENNESSIFKFDDNSDITGHFKVVEQDSETVLVNIKIINNDEVRTDSGYLVKYNKKGSFSVGEVGKDPNSYYVHILATKNNS